LQVVSKMVPTMWKALFSDGAVSQHPDPDPLVVLDPDGPERFLLPLTWSLGRRRRSSSAAAASST